MAFTMGELQLLERLAKDTDNVFPFSLSDEELDTAIAAVKRERGDKLAQIKRKIKTDLAEKFGWKFAMDGGFMQNGQKEWPYGGTMFALLYQEYEKLVLKLNEATNHISNI